MCVYIYLHIDRYLTLYLYYAILWCIIARFNTKSAWKYLRKKLGEEAQTLCLSFASDMLDPSWWFLVVWTLSLRWPIPNLSWHLVGKEFPAKYCSWKIFCFYLFVDWRGLIPKKESSPLLQANPTAPELNIKSVYRCLHWLLQPPLPSISKDSYSLVSLGVGLESLDHHKKT